MAVLWSVYWERAELPPLRVRCKDEADARKEFYSGPWPGYLAYEQIVEKREIAPK